MPERRCQDSKNRHGRVHVMFAPSIPSGFGRDQVIWTEGGVPEACVGLLTCMKAGTMLLAQAHPLGSKDPFRNAGGGELSGQKHSSSGTRMLTHVCQTGPHLRLCIHYLTEPHNYEGSLAHTAVTCFVVGETEAHNSHGFPRASHTLPAPRVGVLLSSSFSPATGILLSPKSKMP